MIQCLAMQPENRSIFQPVPPDSNYKRFFGDGLSSINGIAAQINSLFQMHSAMQRAAWSEMIAQFGTADISGNEDTDIESLKASQLPLLDIIIATYLSENDTEAKRYIQKMAELGGGITDEVNQIITSRISRDYFYSNAQAAIPELLEYSEEYIFRDYFPKLVHPSAAEIVQAYNLTRLQENIAIELLINKLCEGKEKMESIS